MYRRILWADDDGTDRFSYEIEELRRRDWIVSWARDITEAAHLLADGHWDAMLLDQMLPFRKVLGGSIAEPQPRVWGGAVLLWWLRQGAPPPQMPFAESVLSQPFFTLRPDPSNRLIPVAIVSGYYDPLVEKVTRGASDIDTELRLLEKPVELAELTWFLEDCFTSDDSRKGAPHE